LTSKRKDRVLRISLLGALALTLVSGAASAQTTDGGYERALSTSLASVAKAMHSTIRANLADSAAQMSEADFAFRPTPEVRSFGQLVGHVINANYFFALRHPTVFGNVLSQSGAFRLRTPESEEPNSIAQRYAASAKVPVRFYLESGIYENVPSAGLPLHEMALDEGITAGNRHFRDVLMAKGYDVFYRETATAHESVHWRATLADALMKLLNPAIP
jgi:hypothetical protein